MPTVCDTILSSLCSMHALLSPLVLDGGGGGRWSWFYDAWVCGLIVNPSRSHCLLGRTSIVRPSKQCHRRRFPTTPAPIFHQPAVTWEGGGKNGILSPPFPHFFLYSISAPSRHLLVATPSCFVYPHPSRSTCCGLAAARAAVSTIGAHLSSVTRALATTATALLGSAAARSATAIRSARSATALLGNPLVQRPRAATRTRAPLSRATRRVR